MFCYPWKKKWFFHRVASLVSVLSDNSNRQRGEKGTTFIFIPMWFFRSTIFPWRLREGVSRYGSRNKWPKIGNASKTSEVFHSTLSPSLEYLINALGCIVVLCKEFKKKTVLENCLVFLLRRKFTLRMSGSLLKTFRSFS
ncbi:hypothetical protein CEXT_62781 [Caerostris extrusa]|uniref:Uncharacterized protein n=1 Tax=Caerostris extrusa TaxID=172846 RepID=A0AAV4VQ31_CAEEX|nr:hypothetical protein CEXT_62781 [Caerostris extrusa]